MKIELRPLAEIRPYPNNPRLNDNAVDAVAASIREFGFRQPIVVDTDAVIICGHTRYKAAQKLGLEKVPVHVAKDLTPEQIKAFRLADNQTASLAEWNYDLLPIELADLQGMDYDLALLGFDQDELARLLDPGVQEGMCDPDEVPAPPDEAITQPGDLWILGEHRLLCGDSSSPADLDRLLDGHPALRRPVIHGLLREGETMNVIASPKIGKSWLVVDLALAVATGCPWLETFETERGDVLIVDNELHQETSANRIPKVMKARGFALENVADRVFVANVRGGLKDIFGLAEFFQHAAPGRFKLIVLDAFYRFMPKDTDENDNGTMANVYNHLDCYAARLGCSFVLVHHSTKGNQSGKSVTDVGAGAGSQSRATDTHLVLRPHEEPDCVVLDAAVRSWPPIQPRVLRWTFPVWTPDDSLDPAALRPDRPRRRAKGDAEAKGATKPPEPAWDAARFATAFVGETPATILAVVETAKTAGLSERKATRLLKQAERDGLIHRWKFGATHPVQLASIPQPEASA